MKTLLWQGIFYQSLEHFTLKENNGNYAVTSRIIGCLKDQIYSVDYHLMIDLNWNILEFSIESEINTVKNRLTGKKQQDEWEINGHINPDFKGFQYIDISLTPFTNTLPVNKLKLPENGAQEIEVIYIDVLNHLIRPAQQRYTRTFPDRYLYENIQTDFTAEILVDENGLVIDYPELFKKTAEFKS